MHFHLPKPLHGWREFLGEVGIIVLGVLIALGAEQLVEDLSWHRKVGVVRASLMGELANDRARWDLDLQLARCAVRQARAVDLWARDGGHGNAPDFPVRGPMMMTMHTANWTLAASSQTLDHFPIPEQLAFATLYAGIGNRQKTLDATTAAIDRIHGLVKLGSDPQARHELRETLQELSSVIYGLFYNEAYMKRHFDALKVKSDSSDFAADIGEADCGAEAIAT